MNGMLAEFEQPSDGFGVGLVRSMQATNGLKFVLGVPPRSNGPPHCPVLVTAGFVLGLPSELKHTGLKVGSTMPKPSFSVMNVCWNVTPAFRLFTPFT